jgi:uncharacterized protein with FMN-binding domain
MRRTPIVLTATVAGLVGVLGVHPQNQGPLVAATPVSAPKAAAPSRSGSASATPSSQPVSADGPAIPNPYGAVQVRVTAASGKITAIDTLQIPQGDSTSQQISTMAEPQLRSEALAAQSAQIDGVSGASYTSAGYQQSLQAAIDKLPSDSGVTAA